MKEKQKKVRKKKGVRIMKMKKQNKGITLVALVVTIVVLIILATVSINAVFGENGLIRKAEQAKGLYENSVATEQSALDQLVSEYDIMLDDTAPTITTITPSNITYNSITVTVNASDVGSGIASYKYYLEEELKETSTSNSYTYMGLAEGTEYTIKVIIVDRAGKTVESSIKVNTAEKGPNGKQLVSSVTITNHEKIIGEDAKGNQVVVPGGFKIASDSGTSVQQGIVIQDDEGNQFVWVPVSNINHDGSNKIKLDNDSEVEITLGRYTFNASTGVETKVQYGSEYAATSLEAVTATTVSETVLSYRVGSYFYELTDVRESNQVQNTIGTNATAKDLKGFVESVSENKGYYLARYESSYASGSEFGVGNSSSYYKPASKVSTVTKASSSTSLTEGMLWNFITQGNASIASRQMYYGNTYVESDLCNSYAWDTAIVYIQAMGNTNYANANRDTTGNSSILNTGATGDEKCKIYDMAANLFEWTTEYSTSTDKDYAYPCVTSGGNYYDSDHYTSSRDDRWASSIYRNFSFRTALYIK